MSIEGRCASALCLGDQEYGLRAGATWHWRSGADAARTLRGADPDLVFTSGDPFDTTLSTAQHARSGVLANQKVAPYSRMAGALVPCLWMDHRQRLKS